MVVYIKLREGYCLEKTCGGTVSESLTEHFVMRYLVRALPSLLERWATEVAAKTSVQPDTIHLVRRESVSDLGEANVKIELQFVRDCISESERNWLQLCLGELILERFRMWGYKPEGFEVELS